jgi:hypothetical protein
MTVRTKVVWNVTDTVEVGPIIIAELGVRTPLSEDAGGIPEILVDTPVVGQNTYIRGWYDLQSAEEWLVFINSLGVPPVSTAILPTV